MDTITIPTRQAPYRKVFGAYIRELRRARGLTQEAVAERGGIGPDSIRRLEAGSFSPSMATLLKVATGLGLTLGTLLTGFEAGHLRPEQELADLLRLRSPSEVELGLRVLRALFDTIDAASDSARDPADAHE